MTVIVLTFLGFCLLGILFGVINALIYWLAYNEVLQPLIQQVFDYSLPNISYIAVFIFTYVIAVFKVQPITNKLETKEAWVSVLSSFVTKFIYLILSIILFKLFYGC